MKRVIVEINTKTGEVTYEVNGVAGLACEEITEAIVRANEEVEKVYTSEAFPEQELPDYVCNPMSEE